MIDSFVHTVTKPIMSIRIEAFKEVINRGDFRHAVRMLEIIKADIARGALDDWLVNKDYFVSIVDEIISYCLENDSERIKTCLELLEAFLYN